MCLLKFFKILPLIALYVVGGYFCAYTSNEIPDIDVGEIPDLRVSSNLSVSFNILKLCRLTMYSVPMDSYSSDAERNEISDIPITMRQNPANFPLIGATYSPLQFFSNRQILKTYVGGRNVVITQDSNNSSLITMILTGIGPKYNSFERINILNVCTGTNVVDIVDTFDIENTDMFRDNIMHCRRLLELKSILNNKLDDDSFDQIANLAQKDDKLNKIIGEHNILSCIDNCTRHEQIEKLKYCIDYSEEYRFIPQMAEKFIDCLNNIVKKHSAKQKATALIELEKIQQELKNNQIYAQNVIYQVTSLCERTINSSLTGLKIFGDRNHQRALGDLFHSEPLYILWRNKYHASNLFFFTQRDMCPVCDSHICYTALTEKIENIVVLSAKAGNTQPSSVDKILRLKHDKQSANNFVWEESTHQKNTVYKIERELIKRLKKQRDKKDVDHQLSKIVRIRISSLYVDDITEK